MGDEYQYNTFSIDEHFNEDEPQPKLTDIILEVETYFEKNKTIDGQKYQLQKWEKIREDSDGKKWKNYCGCPKISGYFAMCLVQNSRCF